MDEYRVNVNDERKGNKEKINNLNNENGAIATATKLQEASNSTKNNEPEATNNKSKILKLNKAVSWHGYNIPKSKY